MSATPEREQAEALDVVRDCYEQAVRKDWDSVHLATYDLGSALAAVSRLEAERDEAYEELHETERLLDASWRKRDDETEKAMQAETRLAAAVERAEKAEALRVDNERALHLGWSNCVEALDAAVERERELTRALIDARGRMLAIGREGWDSSRWRMTETAVDVLDAALAGGVSAAPDEDEQAYCAECGRAGAPETLPMAYEECPPGAPCRVAEGGVSAAGRPPEQDLGGGTAAVAEAGDDGR